MSPLGIVLTILLVLLLLGGLPVWPHAAYWGGGYGAPGILGIVLIIVLILALTGRL